MHEHLVQPARNAKTHEIVPHKQLWDPKDATEKGRKNVGVHVGEYGRLMWTQNGMECYIQYFPPTEKDLSCPADLLVALMDYANIDMAVLQCGSLYGNLNDYYAMIVDEHPELSNRLLPLARINESKAYTDAQIRRLRHTIEKLKLRGLWFAAEESHFSPRYDEFWNEFEGLGIPVFLAFFPDHNTWMTSVSVLNHWIERFPHIKCVLPQAFPLSSTGPEGTFNEIPAWLRSLIVENEIYIELVYPISRGAIEDYPFPGSAQAVKTLYDSLGPERLVWGSDVPMVNRYCTYTQSLTCVTKHCSFIGPDDMTQIVGGNLRRIFSLQ
jgi:predicted TIM-barrel fold metal-dependent hydrolase